MYRLFNLFNGVGLSLVVTFFLKGILGERHSLYLIGFCILASRIIWPKEGKQYLYTLLGFVIGILISLILTDLDFSWLFYLYFIMAGFLERLYRHHTIKKRTLTG